MSEQIIIMLDRKREIHQLKYPLAEAIRMLRNLFVTRIPELRSPYTVSQASHEER